jgi:hypothetical protein
MTTADNRCLLLRLGRHLAAPPRPDCHHFARQLQKVPKRAAKRQKKDIKILCESGVWQTTAFSSERDRADGDASDHDDHEDAGGMVRVRQLFVPPTGSLLVSKT